MRENNKSLIHEIMLLKKKQQFDSLQSYEQRKRESMNLQRDNSRNHGMINHTDMYHNCGGRFMSLRPSELYRRHTPTHPHMDESIYAVEVMLNKE